MKVQIKYIGKHEPHLVSEVEEQYAEKLVATGEYEYVKNESIVNEDRGDTRVEDLSNKTSRAKAKKRE